MYKTFISMTFKTISIDCSGMSKEGLHLAMKELLGFPEFYGMNWDALYDCLSSMRLRGSGMSEITLTADEMLIIECKSLQKAEFDVGIFMEIIEAVNARELDAGNKSLILLNLIQ